MLHNAWDAARKGAAKDISYEDTLRDYDKMWGGNELLHHRCNTKTMHWNVKAPNIVFVNHA